MRFVLTISLLLLLLPSSIHILSAQNYTLSNWTVEDGLSSNGVRGILQDEEGFMWIATDHGLNQFDGYTFKNHRYIPGDSTSIGANYINQICEDDQGNIWVSLGVGILSRYNKRSKKFTNYIFPLHQTFIFEIEYMPGQGIFIATNQGLFTVDLQSDKIVSLLDKKKVYKIFPANDQQLFLNMDEGFTLFNTKDNSSLLTSFVHQNDTLPFVYSIANHFTDAKGLNWIQTTSGSICQAEDALYFKKSLIEDGITPSVPKKGQLFIFEKNETRKWFVSTSCEILSYHNDSQSWKPLPNSYLANESLSFSFKDQEDNIWICTKSNKLLKWSGKTWEFILNLDKEGLQFWNISHVFVDRENGIWLGSHQKGLWRIFNRTWPIYSVALETPDQILDFNIAALYMESDDYMWIGAYNDLYQYHFESKKLSPWRSGLKQENPFNKIRINDIKRGKEEELWLATNNGLVLINTAQQTYQRFSSEIINNKKVELGYTRCILPDAQGNVWIGSTQGLFRYESDTKKIKAYSPTGAPGSLRSSNISCFTQLNDNQFLIGFIRDGVDLITFDSIHRTIHCQKVPYPGSESKQFDMMTANTFYFDGTSYWLGTFSRGLLKLDLENLQIQPLSPDFPIIPNVKGIQQGSNGNLWVSSIDGIRSINPEDQTFYRFTKSSGLLSNQFNTNSDAQDHSGNLYFGGLAGLNKIQPNKWSNADTLATPILTDFKTFDKRNIFDQPLDHVKKIELEPEDDFITIEFVSPTYDNPADVQYAYQLTGFNDKWIYCETQRSATYTNLAPGQYIFKVKAGNKGGFLNSKIKQVQIIVNPPFWQTGWFAFAVLLFLFLVWWLVYRIQQNIRLNRLKIATEVRQKAAADFHDELGHRLTKIVLFVESLMLQKDTLPNKSLHTLRKIQDNANDLYYSTRDFIWAMNPSKDSALDLFILLRDFGDELFQDTDIQFSVDGIKETYKDHLLDMDWKRQLVMIFKEAMNNALKHADCSNVVLKIRQYEKQIHIILKDDGKGFILSHEKFGYGLGSMFNRSKKIDGKLEVKSQPKAGTEIILKFTT